MEKKCVTVGKPNRNHLFFVFAIICSLANDIAFGSANVNVFERLKLKNFETSNSFLIHKIFCYLCIIFLSYIFYKIETKNSTSEDDKGNTNDVILKRESNTLELIHNDQEEELGTFSDYNLLIIVIVWIIEEELLSYYGDIMMHLDFWMVELLIISYFMVKILKIEVYKHQKLMLGLTSIPLILKIVTIILSFDDENNHFEKGVDKDYRYAPNVNKLKLLYVANNIIIPFGLIYFCSITLRSYINTELKWLIDKKFISPVKLFFLYGIIGFVFCLIICIFATFFECCQDEGNEYTIYDYFCQVKYDNKKYLDNFQAFFTMEDNILIEIITVIIGAVTFAFCKYFILKTIQHLTPVHVIFCFPIYYILNKIYLLIINYNDTGQPYIKDMKYSTEILCLDFSSDIVSIIIYLIYLEIIEFHCFGYDFNIRINILERCKLDADLSKLNETLKSSSDVGVESRNESYSSIHSSNENNENNGT